jgi:transcriptional regulator with XRE-family HTH domain
MTTQRSSAVAERFGANLRRVRRREGLSQEGLAVRASLCTGPRSVAWRAASVPVGSTP